MSSNNRGTSIADEAYQAQNAFEECISASQDHPDKEQFSEILGQFKDGLRQFKAWTQTFGALASDEASLDYRLHHLDDFRETHLRLLRNITTSLKECFMLFKSGDTWIDINEEGLSDSMGDTSSNSSRDSSAETELPQRPSLVRSRLEILSYLASDIRTSIDNLLVLGCHMRKSGLSDRIFNRKGLRDELIYSVQGLDFTSVAKILNWHHKVEEPLLSRLTAAIARRRMFFNYSASHQQKLAFGGREPVLSGGSIHKSVRIIRSEAYISGDQSSIMASEGKSDTLSSSALPASVRNLPFMHIQALDILPNPPPLLDQSSYFECPYCHILLQADRQQLLSWRLHVFHDLRPFVCLAPECATPDISFLDESEWLEHQSLHVLEWWCDGDAGTHEPRAFRSTDELRAHTKSNHQHTLKNAYELDLVIKHGSKPSEVVFNCCPFCSIKLEIGSNQNKEQAQQPVVEPPLMREEQLNLMYHILNHLLEFFQYALLNDSGYETESERDTEEGWSGAKVFSDTLSRYSGSDTTRSSTGSRSIASAGYKIDTKLLPYHSLKTPDDPDPFSFQKSSSGATTVSELSRGRTLTSMTHTRSSAYSRNFDEIMNDLGHKKGLQVLEPKNASELKVRLQRRRPSLSPLSTDAAFKKFLKACNIAEDSFERLVSTDVIPTLVGSQKIHLFRGINFNKVEPLTNTLASARSDFCDGCNPSVVDPEIKRELAHLIEPSTHLCLPNFVLEVESEKGQMKTLLNQVFQLSCISARAMHAIRKYAYAEPIDQNAYSISAALIIGNNLNLLQLFVTYPLPDSEEGSLKWHMHRLAQWILDEDTDTFREAITWLRNAREWAKEQRENAIEAANQKALQGESTKRPSGMTNAFMYDTLNFPERLREREEDKEREYHGDTSIAVSENETRSERQASRNTKRRRL